jgi:RNA polymerase sigma-70 factor (ECF subfamily)
MVPTRANGQLAVKAYRKGEPFGISVLTLTPAGIARIVVFGDAQLVGRFA